MVMIVEVSAQKELQPENPYIVRYMGVADDSDYSQAFLFGGSKMGKLVDLTGQTYGRLTVLHRDKTRGGGHGGHVYWICRCIYGTICSVSSNCMREGSTKSCGCLKKETCRENGSYLGGIVQKYPAEYHTWWDIQGRCYNQNDSSFPYYGGRGIEVCDRWKSGFKYFMEDMGPRPIGNYSIDRIDNDGDYTPDNCKWSTRMEQAANTRKNVLYKYGEEILHQRALARKLGVDHHTIARKYKQFRVV